MIREVDACPHRRPAPGRPPGVAECGLLRSLAGVEDGRLTEVDRDACASCCSEIPPNEWGLNPTLASLLYRIAGEVAGRGGVAGCPADRAVELRRLAEADLALGRGDPPRPDGPGPGISRRDEGRPDRVGLVGWNTPTGLGRLNRDLARHLPVDRWLIPRHPVFREMPGPIPCPSWRATTPDDLRAFLDGLDCLLFCEHPYFGAIAPMARSMGVRVACVPMWEYLHEMAPWLRLVDLMICPTRVCLDVVRRLRERLGLACDVEWVPWPVDLDLFPSCPRTTCDRFLFINGTGGAREVDSGREGWDGRKGVGVVAAAARLAPGVPILVRSQTGHLPDFPPNVEVRVGDLDDPADLYREGDVCIQPSRWEGLGLPLLECQASGLPLVTTDAAPMNEHRPLRTLPATPSPARLAGRRSFPAYEVAPDALACVLRELHGSSIADASVQARRFVESEHSWTSAGPRLDQILRTEARRPIHVSR